MYQIKCGLKPRNEIPVICDTIENFLKFDKLFQSRDVPNGNQILKLKEMEI